MPLFSASARTSIARKRLVRWLCCTAMGSILGLAAGTRLGWAAEVPHSLRAWLQGIEALPSGDELRRAGGRRVTELLAAVAHDPTERTYARHRAISFLGILAEPAAAVRLSAFLTVADEDLRATAALAYTTGPLRQRLDAASWRRVDTLLADPSAKVRTASARGIGMAGEVGRARSRLLARRAAESDASVSRAVTTALRRLEQRAGRGQRQ